MPNKSAIKVKYIGLYANFRTLIREYRMFKDRKMDKQYEEEDRFWRAKL